MFGGAADCASAADDRRARRRNVMRGYHSLTQEGHEYLRRMQDLINVGTAHPLQMLNPFHVAEKLSSTNENEPAARTACWLAMPRTVPLSTYATPSARSRSSHEARHW